ncbi:MFS transporter [Embleya scabrispora]|uniref:MFS transporter n=1 Tax=Embleya scabrispora TaxID=159449 RepID=A0A1T3NN28_9ACTN|nr:MFS transporter [Embleya scabrispora]OPC78132.1 MFS transporter [Embleya scabrispora]
MVPTLAFGGVLMALMQTVIVPLLPALPGDTGSSPGTVSWMLTATLLSGAVLNPVLGRAGDMYGRRRILVAALVGMTVGSALCALTTDIGVLITARALQGTAAAVVPLATGILREELPPHRVGSAVALMSSTVGIGAAAGLPLASIVVRHADWHVLFWVTTGLGALGAGLSWWVLPRSSARTPGRFDVVGALLLTTGLVGVLLAVSKGGDWGWTSPAVLGVGAGGVLVLPLWGRHQLRSREPLVDLRLAARRTVLLPHLAALVTGFAFYANWLATVQLVQAPEGTGYGLGASALVASLCLLPGGVAMVVMSPVSARLSAARGARLTLVAGALGIAGAYVVRVFTSEQMWTITAGATMCSIGTGLVYSALPTLVIQAVPAAQTAAATGLNVLMRTIGQALCSTVVAVVLTTVTTTVPADPGDATGGTYASLDAYRIVFALAAAAALAAALTAAAIPRTATPPSAGPGTREAARRASRTLS